MVKSATDTSEYWTFIIFKSLHVFSFSLADKSAGVVTTTRVTHATPAAAYAHTPHRDWERAFDVPESQEKCLDIASQLIMENDIQVLFTLLG